jgi:2-iminobutanoate/2-iminopropanoate deaminase
VAIVAMEDDMTDTSSPAPRPVGPYTAIVRAGDWLICSGQLGLANGALAEGVGAQVTQAVANVASLLAIEGARLDQVAKTAVFLSDIAEYPEMNEAYVAAFGSHRPARSAFAVAGLPMGALVEIEAWAYTG